MPRIVRFRHLEPTWTTHRAHEPGFMRWLVTWVGGPAGHINTNPGVALESSRCAIGLMHLPPGQRQSGKHIHSVAEIYVVLQGTLEGFDASGELHRAGLLDCTVTPAGCPHGVRNCGADDVVLIWVHDGIEADGVSTYYPDDHPFGDVPPMQLVRFADLPPGRSAAWVAGLPGSPAPQTGAAASNERVALGTTLLEPGQQLPATPLPVTRFYLITEGEAAVVGATPLTRLDGLQITAGESVELRNDGSTSLRLLWVDSPAG